MPRRISSHWKEIYAQDREFLEALLKTGHSPKSARQIAYHHQYDYLKTPGGKAAKRRYRQSEKGKATTKAYNLKNREKINARRRELRKLKKEKKKEVVVEK